MFRPIVSADPRATWRRQLEPIVAVVGPHAMFKFRQYKIYGDKFHWYLHVEGYGDVVIVVPPGEWWHEVVAPAAQTIRGNGETVRIAG